MFVNKWYNIQLRPDYVDKVWHKDVNGNEVIDDDGGGTNPKDPTDPTDEGGGGGADLVMQITNIQTGEAIVSYYESAGISTTTNNKKGFENLDVGFAWSVVPDSTLINCFNAKETKGIQNQTISYIARPYTITDFELRKIIKGYEADPFDPQGYVKVATGQQPARSWINDNDLKKYYHMSEFAILRQNLLLINPNHGGISGQMSFVKKYDGPERRFLVGKLSKIEKNQNGYYNGILEFNLDDSEFYDSNEQAFTFDGAVISKTEFINRYVRSRTWRFPTGKTIYNIVWYAKCLNTANDIDGTGIAEFDDVEYSKFPGSHIVLSNPEDVGVELGKLYDESRNTLRFHTGGDLETLVDSGGLAIGAEIKIELEPRLSEDTYYYLTLTNPKYKYINTSVNVEYDTPIYWIIDDNPITSTKSCIQTIPDIRNTSFPEIQRSLQFQYNKDQFYNSSNWISKPDDLGQYQTDGSPGLRAPQENENNYFAWFKTPPIWKPYLEPDAPKPPDPEPPKPPTLYSYNPTIKFGYSYETYNAGTDPDNTGTVKGQSITFDTYKVTLKGRFWYDKLDYNSSDGSLAYPKDLPISVGFLVKKTGDTDFKFIDNYKLEIFDKNGALAAVSTVKSSDSIPYIVNLETKAYTKDLPGGKGGYDNDRYVNFSTTFVVGASINWKYRIFVKNTNGLFYADPTLKLGSIKPNDLVNLGTGGGTAPYFEEYDLNCFRIKTPSVDLTDWKQPDGKSTGYWYQIYNSWKEVTNQNRISPYLTVRIHDNIGFPTNPTNKVDKQYPVHYYLNYVFNSDKNFQFRTVVENYYNYESVNLGTTYYDDEKPDIKFKTPWGEEINMPTPFIGIKQVPDVLKRINIYSYSNINGYTNTNEVKSPKKLISSKTNPQNPITYTTNTKFGAQGGIIESGLCHVSVSENDWTIQGSAVWNVMTQTTNGTVEPDAPIQVPYFYNGRPYAGRGWHHLPKEGKFIWFDSLYAGTGNNPFHAYDINKCFPMGGDPNDYFSGKESNIGYMPNNFISTYIPFQLFNLNFEYTNYSPSKITMYMGGELPYKDGNLKTNIDDLIEKGKVKKIGILGTSTGKKQKCDFIGLVGNQYLFFVAEPILDFKNPDNFTNYNATNTMPKVARTVGPVDGKWHLSSGTGTTGIGTYSVIEISNFGISGTYNKGNNLVHQTQIGSYKTNITNAAYSIKLGVGNNVFSDSINSTVIVNTKSGNGTMHSGIWENGVWNSGWRSDTTTRDFRSVGQYYSYDKDRTWRMSINGRESSVNYFKVGDVVAISNVVAIDINEERKLLKSGFRIISKTIDSIVVEFDTDFPIRRIVKDSSEHRILVTKNVWLNGVFLNGYFKGVWNNGLFSGFPMITKMDSSHWIDGIFNGGHFTAKKLRITSFGNNIAKSYKVDDKERMAISFTNDHNIEKDDVISMTYSTTNITNGALGSTIVLDVPDSKTVVTGIGWRNELATIKSITFITSISDGLVQNFEFHANNVSTVTSLDTLLSERVFSYNSWMDINYSNKSAINIGRPQTLLNEHDKAYSENNLYGYPTNDILSSKSTFRDSYSRTVRNYKLGKKYKIYKDYVGESSGFENYFDPTDTTQGDETFKEQGWNWSKSQETIRTITAASAEKSTTSKLSLKIPIENPYVMSLTGSVTITGPVEMLVAGNIDSYGIMSTSTTIDNVTKDSAQYTVNTSSDVFTTTNGPSWAINTTTIPENKKPSDINFYISTTQSGSIKFSRTPEPSGQGIPGQGKELLVTALGSGGILYLKENKNVETLEIFDPVPKQRYTMVEFNLINYKGSADGKGEYTDDIGTLPPIHFNNVNRVFRKTSNGVVNLSATYLPIYKNVNHVATFGEKKQEFFFNKRNILMSFTGYGSLGSRYSEYMIDNLKLYEVDMVPFFQYFKNPFGKTGNINTSVQIPNTGESPGLIESSDKVIDATTENEVVNKFVSEFVSFNTQIPNAVNWRRDYAIYGPQMSDSYTDPRLY